MNDNEKRISEGYGWFSIGEYEKYKVEVLKEFSSIWNSKEDKILKITNKKETEMENKQVEFILNGESKIHEIPTDIFSFAVNECSTITIIPANPDILKPMQVIVNEITFSGKDQQ